MRRGNSAPQRLSAPATSKEVLARDSFLDILGHFMFIEKTEERSMARAGSNASSRGVDLPALSPTRCGARHRPKPGVKARPQLSHPAFGGVEAAKPTASRGGCTAWQVCNDAAGRQNLQLCDRITDRRVLDAQLQDAIYQIEHAQGVVKAINQDSKQLPPLLIDGTQIVITTLQKFLFVLRGLLHAVGKREPVTRPALKKNNRPRRSGRRRAPLRSHRR
ncbi:MAG: hypothetical protein U1F68_13170 [Gammaproteobacteria bacterium]